MFEPDPPSGDFELGTTGIWEPASFYPCAIEADGVGVARNGSWSLKMTSTAETGQTMALSTPQSSPNFMVASPGRFRVGGWARSASAQVDHFEMRIAWFNADGTVFVGVHNGRRSAAVLDQYVRVGGEVVVAPEGTGVGLLQLHASAPLDGDFDAGQVVNWDDIFWETVLTQEGIVFGAVFSA